MAAYESHGRGILTRVRVDHRLSLEELARLLFLSNEDTDTDLSIQTARQAVSETLRFGGTDALVRVSDILSEGDTDDKARMAWCRQQVARAYRRDFAQFPATIAKFERTAQASGEPR